MTARMLAAGAVLFLAACSKSPEPVAAPVAEAGPASPAVVKLDEKAMRESGIEVAAAELRPIPVTVAASGRLTPNENTTWRVGAITDGRIIRVMAKVGDRVGKDQVLARMHSHDIHEARAQYRRAVAEVTRLKSNVEFARRTRDRMKRLYEMKAASFEQSDQAENALKNEQTALANAEIEERRTRLHLVEFLEIPIEGPEEHGHGSSPEDHIDDLIPVRAPAAGIVLNRLVTQGAVVSASSDLFTICDLSTIWVQAAVQEEHLSKLKVGSTARVSVQAYPGRRFTGRVVKIDSVLDAETRTVSARIEIDNRPGLLKPEMYGSVEIESGASAPGVFVAQEAVQDVNGRPTVFVEAGPNTFKPVAVTIDRTIESLVHVSSGLKGGERVVVRGSFILKSQLLRSLLAEEE